MAEPAQEQLIFLFALGTIGILTLVIFIVLFFFIYQKRILKIQQQEQKREIEFQEELINAQLESQEKERVRIAADLHDSLGSLLWGAKVNAAFIERSIKMKGEEKQSHADLVEILDQSIETVRRIAWELTPEAFQLSGLSHALRKLCERIEGKPLNVYFQEDQTVFWNTMNALQTYRIVQELVSNCVKHARASELRLELNWNQNHLKISVSDNGIGFSLTESRAGVGWWSIQQRAKQIQAKIRIGNTPTGQGSEIQMEIPLT